MMTPSPGVVAYCTKLYSSGIQIALPSVVDNICTAYIPVNDLTLGDGEPKPHFERSTACLNLGCSSQVCVKNLGDHHGTSLVNCYCCNKEHQVWVAYLSHHAGLPANAVHSSWLKDALIHSLDTNSLTLKVSLRSNPSGTTSINFLVHLGLFSLPKFSFLEEMLGPSRC